MSSFIFSPALNGHPESLQLASLCLMNRIREEGCLLEEPAFGIW